MILKTLIRKDVGLELNTAGYKYGLGHPNPTEAILKDTRNSAAKSSPSAVTAMLRSSWPGILRKFRLS